MRFIFSISVKYGKIILPQRELGVFIKIKP